MSVEHVHAARFEHGQLAPCREALTPELPLQIKLNGRPFSVTMRSPGADRELVQGLLFTEGIVRTDADTPAAEFRDEIDPGTGAIAAIDVRIPPAYLCPDAYARRALLASAACGLCGQRELDAGLAEFPPLPPPTPLPLARVSGMLQQMRAAQHTFAATGSTHAAACFDAAGTSLCVFEDIGRHNAVDKAIGRLLARGTLAQAHALAVSGRVSFEIVLKAYRAGIPFLLAVSAPSSFAVTMSAAWNLCLIAYCRDQRCTLYTHPEHAQS